MKLIQNQRGIGVVGIIFIVIGVLLLLGALFTFNIFMEFRQKAMEQKAIVDSQRTQNSPTQP